MKPTPITPEDVVLIPAKEDALRIGVLPGADGGIAVALHLETPNVGKFVVPISAAQLGVIVAVGNVLLKLDADKAAQLRARLVRELENNTEGNQL